MLIPFLLCCEIIKCKTMIENKMLNRGQRNTESSCRTLYNFHSHTETPSTMHLSTYMVISWPWVGVLSIKSSSIHIVSKKGPCTQRFNLNCTSSVQSVFQTPWIAYLWLTVTMSQGGLADCSCWHISAAKLVLPMPLSPHSTTPTEGYTDTELLFISCKFVKGFLAKLHDMCQRFLCSQKRNFNWILQKTKNFPIDPHCKNLPLW